MRHSTLRRSAVEWTTGIGTCCNAPSIRSSRSDLHNLLEADIASTLLKEQGGEFSGRQHRITLQPVMDHSQSIGETATNRGKVKSAKSAITVREGGTRKQTDHPAKTAVYQIVAGNQHFVHCLEASRISVRTYRSRLHSIPCHQHRRRLYRLKDLAERR